MEIGVLAGGLGTRLASITQGRPKILVDIAGKPFAHYLLDGLHSAGYKRVVFMAGFGAEELRERLGLRYRDMEVDYSVEAEQLGTGGACRLYALRSEKSFIDVVNGDTIGAIPDGKMLASMREDQNIIGCVHLKELGARFGTVEYCTTSKRVTAFKEKLGGSSRGSSVNAVSSGFYRLNRSSIAQYDKTKFSMEYDYLPMLVSQGSLYSCDIGETDFIDIGIPEDFLAFSKKHHS